MAFVDQVIASSLAGLRVAPASTGQATALPPVEVAPIIPSDFLDFTKFLVLLIHLSGTDFLFSSLLFFLFFTIQRTLTSWPCLGE